MPEDTLLNHITRCKATNKHLFTKCRYNPLHIYPTLQLDNHYKSRILSYLKNVRIKRGMKKMISSLVMTGGQVIPMVKINTTISRMRGEKMKTQTTVKMDRLIEGAISV